MKQVLMRSGTLPAALGSLGSLLAQAVMAFLLLGLFQPQAIGTFSLIAQISFGWAMLALAQSPVSLLANLHLPALAAARQAWRSSLLRWLWLTPAAAAAVWWAGQSGSESKIASEWLSQMMWVTAIAIAQMGWLLAQSLTLRLQNPVSIAAVRMLPSALAAVLVGTVAFTVDWRNSSALTTAALAGYVIGALWLLPALRNNEPSQERLLHKPTQSDTRSTQLKFFHTLSDVFVATALAAHWTAVYGATQAGCLLILLRVMGFVPALVGSAWAHVVLSRPQTQRPSSILAAGFGVFAVTAIGLTAALALHIGWLSEDWLVLQDYIWPIVLWQSAASVMTAALHLPFQHGRAKTYTQQCLAINAVQVALLLLPPLLDFSVQTHLWALAGFMSLVLSFQALWAALLSKQFHNQTTSQ